MALAFDRTQEIDASSPAPRLADQADRRRRFSRGLDTTGGPNTISASQARAARRREARRDQQAVAAWLRELSR